jgi:predicted PurR-regulated permease PerM
VPPGLARWALWLVVVLAGGFLLRISAGFSVPLVFAAFLAVLFTPGGDFLERHSIPAAVATALCVLVVLATLALFGALVSISVASVMNKSSTYADRASEIVASISSWSEAYLSLDLVDALSTKDLKLPPLLQQAMRPVGDLAQVLAGLLFTLVFFAFLFHFRHEIRDRLFEIVVHESEAARERELAIVGAGVTIRRYLWIKFIMSVGTGAAIGLASWALNLDFPLVWALIAVALNFIPSVGPMLAVLPAAGVALVQGGLPFGVLVTAVMAAIHFVSGNVIEPIIVGYRLRLNFLVVLLSLFVWSLVWGFAGMVLAVPITACIKLALDYSGERTALGTILGSPHEPALPEVPAARSRARSQASRAG